MKTLHPIKHDPLNSTNLTAEIHESIEDFFTYYNLTDIQSNLRKLIEVAVTSDNETFSHHTQRGEIVFFNHQLELFIIALYRLYQQTRANEIVNVPDECNEGQQMLI